MAQEGFKRKLTAILSADVKGYSRLMGEDEEATVRTLTAYREVFTTLIQQHNGRVIDSPGDNLLVEFVSVVDAVQCAVAVQKEINARNNELPENRRMQFRVGINLGDVIQEEERIYGDGVNIAARLEGLAEPGGICISKTAFDQIETKLPYGYEFLGDQTVKNIPKPVGAYRVLMEPRVTVAGEPKKEKPAPGRRKALLVGVAALLIVAVAVGVWQFYMHRRTIEPAAEEKMAFPLPEKPSVAVLPFVNMSGDPNQEYLVDGISDNIITTLSTIPDILVIDRNSVLSFKEKSVKAEQVAQELDVQYVVEGSLQKAGESIQINTRLLDALTGHNLWAKSIKTDLNDIFEVQNEITIHVLKAIYVESIHGADAEFYFGTKSIEALNYFKKGEDHYLRFRCEDLGKAIVSYKKALEIDPDYAAAWADLAWVYHDAREFWCAQGYGLSHERLKTLRTECLARALAIDSTIPTAHVLLARTYQTSGQYEIAKKQLEDAIAKNPDSAELYRALGTLLSEGGRAKESIALIEKAIRLNPFYPGYYLGFLSRSYFLSQQYDNGIEIAEQLLDRGQKIGDKAMIDQGHMLMAINLVELGKIEQAQAHMREYLKTHPTLHLGFFEGMWKDRFQNPTDLERILNAMHKAGIPKK
jgi:TolB-like protein/class 3 adenylate cyclase/Tfp pilus assembly protein PilF